jgi:hypothetical protein
MSLQMKIFIILAYIFSFIYCQEIVSIPFNSQYNRKNKKSITSLDDLADTNLYTKISIGEPSHEIQAFLSVQHSYFSISSSKNIKNINDFQSHYNIIKSNSFKNILTGRTLAEANYNSMAMEKFKLNIFNYKKREYYNTSINDMIFIYNNKDNVNEKSYYLNIGFQIINQKFFKEREKYNFITQLKKREIIGNYDWSIFFKKGPNNNGNFLYNPDYLLNAKGEILIGDLPNNYNPNNFNIQQLKKTYSKYTPLLFKWGLEFKNIYFYKNNNESNIISNKNGTNMENISVTDVQININQYIILSPLIYFYKIKTYFFDYYIKEGICKINEGIEYKTISCEKSKKFGIDNLKKFPSLFMEHHEFNYTFEFTYEDLFLEKDNNYWFLVALSSFKNDLEEWNMGIIFLRKYNLIFNQDTKTISFYNTNIIIEDIDDKKWNRIALISILTIILIGIFFIIGIIYIYICKKLFKSYKGKKRINHIYDNSDYLKEDKIDINKKAYYQQLLVEMKGLVLS